MSFHRRETLPHPQVFPVFPIPIPCKLVNVEWCLTLTVRFREVFPTGGSNPIMLYPQVHEDLLAGVPKRNRTHEQAEVTNGNMPLKVLNNLSVGDLAHCSPIVTIAPLKAASH